MDQTHPANIECNNINNSNDNNNNVSNSNINNKVDAVKKDVLILQSSVTKRKPEDIEATWRGPEGEAGSRVWVVKVFIFSHILVFIIHCCFIVALRIILWLREKLLLDF